MDLILIVGSWMQILLFVLRTANSPVVFVVMSLTSGHQLMGPYLVAGLYSDVHCSLHRFIAQRVYTSTLVHLGRHYMIHRTGVEDQPYGTAQDW